jgi:hypothetical protein
MYGNRTLGIEYQVLDDDAHTLKPKGMTGSLYDVYEPNEAKALNPVGEWNHSRIVVWGDHIEHWLNGRQIISAEVGSVEWSRRIAESKFAAVEGFGQNRSGRIMLTDHNSDVWYRNILLKPLPPPEPTLLVAKSPKPEPRRGVCQPRRVRRIMSRIRSRSFRDPCTSRSRFFQRPR